MEKDAVDAASFAERAQQQAGEHRHPNSGEHERQIRDTKAEQANGIQVRLAREEERMRKQCDATRDEMDGRTHDGVASERLK
eukprot:gene38603-43089_t